MHGFSSLLPDKDYIFVFENVLEANSLRRVLGRNAPYESVLKLVNKVLVDELAHVLHSRILAQHQWVIEIRSSCRGVVTLIITLSSITNRLQDCLFGGGGVIGCMTNLLCVS